MDENIINLIKNSRIFAPLSEEARKELLLKFSEVTLYQNEYLFNQGDLSDSIYLLTQGKLGAELTTSTGETKIIGHIDPGETVGELGALSNEPRSLSIKALKNSVLLKLSTEYFVALCHQFPAVMFETVHPIITRSKSIIQILSTEKNIKHITIVPANKDISLNAFSEKLLTFAAGYLGLVTVSEYQSEFAENHMDVTTLKQKILQLAHEKKSSHRILYILKKYDTSLAKLAFRKADIIYVVGDSRVTPKIDRHIIDKIQSHRLHLRSDPELILLHPENAATPKNTAAWLAQTPFALQHHVRDNHTKDYHRLLRFIRGKAVGLVLSGGGTRGWAHLGAIQALREAKIPIDMIGGTSVGALVGACYAINESYEEAYEKFYKIVDASDHSVSWRSLTWPAISLFNAKSFTESQMQVFGSQLIEDLWLPFFCVSSNLASNNESIHTTGILWEKTRASSSIPGLIPPMLIDGELHFDGGLLNNLPVDIMRQFVGTRGKIIAIDLNSYMADRHKYNFPPILTFKDALFSKLGIGENGFKFPRFTDTFMRGLFVGSLLKSRQNSLAANLFVSLNLSKFRLLHSNIKQANRLIEVGYHETLLKCMYQSNKKI
jgi:NTE family protein